MIGKNIIDRSHTTVILAMTADGKIADKKKSAARFGSTEDKLHLETQIALADGVMFGAGTLRAYGTSLVITNSNLLLIREGRSLQPFHIVVSASGQLNTQLKFFQQPLCRWLLTTNKGAKLWQDKSEFNKILIVDGDFKSESQTSSLTAFNWTEILIKLRQIGIKKLAILGGGKLIASLLAEDLIDEFWLTVCPVIFGGENATTPVSGEGWLQAQGKSLKLLEVKQIEDEVFLHYLVNH